MQKVHYIISGANNLPISIDLSSINDQTKKPLVIFCHGFKGFKDWGAWNLVANKFANNNFIFLKFNFSHNGTSPNSLEDFENITAFSENNYSKELLDLQLVIDWAKSDEFPLKNSWNQKVFLIGHSRGCGAVLVKNGEEEIVNKTCTWSAIDSFDRFGTKAQIKQWGIDGEHIFTNGRTGQKMPIKYQFYTDYLKYIKRLNIKNTVQKNLKPLLIIHGKDDPAVHIDSARNLYSWSKNAQLIEIDNADHVFGSKHPFQEEVLPIHLENISDLTIKFFNK